MWGRWKIQKLIIQLSKQNSKRTHTDIKCWQALKEKLNKSKLSGGTQWTRDPAAHPGSPGPHFRPTFASRNKCLVLPHVLPDSSEIGNPGFYGSSTKFQMLTPNSRFLFLKLWARPNTRRSKYIHKSPLAGRWHCKTSARKQQNQIDTIKHHIRCYNNMCV